MQEKCKRYLQTKKVISKTFLSNRMEDIFQQYYSNSNMRYDPRNQVLYCIPSKTGIGTWYELATVIKHNSTFYTVPMKSVTALQTEIPTLYEWRTQTRTLSALGHEVFIDFLKNYIQKHKFDSQRLNWFVEKSGGQLPDMYYGIMTARHPLARVYSAYIHNFYDGLEQRLSFEKHIHIIQQNYAKPNEHIALGFSISFPAFVRFVASNEAHSDALIHSSWTPLVDLCKFDS